MRRKIDAEIKAGIFIFFGILLIMITILLMGGGESLFQKNYSLYVVIPDASGLATGAAVRSGGLKIGRIDQINYSQGYDNLKLSLLINEKFKNRIHSDAIVRLQTQGVLGDKYLEISGGSPNKPIAENGATIEAELSKDLSSMLSEGETAVQLLKENLINMRTITAEITAHNNMQHIMHDLAETTSNMKTITQQLKNGSAMNDLNQTMKNVRLVSEKMKNGEGTIGALFADSSLYEDLKHLIGGASRNNVLKFFVRQAVKTSDEKALKEEENQKELKKAK